MPGSDEKEVTGRGPRIFISYSRSDAGIARRLAQEINQAGLDCWFDEWEIGPGDSISSKLEEGIRSADIILVLASHTSVKSHWVDAELGSKYYCDRLRDRAISIVPAFIDDCRLPPLLADRQCLDLRSHSTENFSRVVKKLTSAHRLNLAELDPTAFEKLAHDLIRDRGFAINSSGECGDTIATIEDRDPFGAARKDNWLLVVKHYRSGRVDIATLRGIVGILAASHDLRGCLLITSGSLTSVAREFVQDRNRTFGREIRVLDGTELTSLLLQHPDLVKRYFPAGGER